MTMFGIALDLDSSNLCAIVAQASVVLLERTSASNVSCSGERMKGSFGTEAAGSTVEYVKVTFAAGKIG